MGKPTSWHSRGCYSDSLPTVLPYSSGFSQQRHWASQQLLRKSRKKKNSPYIWWDLRVSVGSKKKGSQVRCDEVLLKAVSKRYAVLHGRITWRCFASLSATAHSLTFVCIHLEVLLWHWINLKVHQHRRGIPLIPLISNMGKMRLSLLQKHVHIPSKSVCNAELKHEHIVLLDCFISCGYCCSSEFEMSQTLH